ncbi:MAG: transposase [Chlamydiales bacterium]|nr:transposase [Chlamydiales bacterium]
MDRIPVPVLLKNMRGKGYANMGSIGQKLFNLLRKMGLSLFTKIQKNRKNILMPIWIK